MPVEQLGDRVRLADARVRLDVDAELDDRLDLARDERAGEPVLGDAEHHHAAEPVLRLVDRDRMAGEAKVARGGEAGGPAADHADARTGRGRHLAVRRVPHRVRGEALDAEALGDEPLQRPDRDRRVDRASPARALARRRAHASAHRRERVRRARDEVRVLEAAFGDRGHVRARVGVAPGTRRGTARSPRASPRRARPGSASDHLPALELPERPRHREQHDEEHRRRDPRRGCCASCRAPS